MKKILIILLSILASCSTNNDKNDIIVEEVEYIINKNTLTETLPFASIEIVPLSTPKDVIIADNMQLCELDGEIYISSNLDNNKGVYRFNKKGEFINKISNHGNAKNEFIELSDISLTDDGNIALYSGRNGNILYFTKDNKLIDKIDIKNVFTKATSYKDVNLIYYGYNNPYKLGRFTVVSKKGEVMTEYLNSESNVMPMQEIFPIFYKNGDNIYMRETTNNIVYKFANDRIETLYKFDFGKYNIPSNYYQQDSPINAFKLIAEKGFAAINLFMENKSSTILKATVQKPDFSFDIVYGIQNIDKKEWKWYTTINTEIPNDIFSEGIKYLTEDNYILCLVEQHKLDSINNKSIFTNSEILETLGDNSNAVMLKCKLK